MSRRPRAFPAQSILYIAVLIAMFIDWLVRIFVLKPKHLQRATLLPPMTALEFEHYCANTLSLQGWLTYLTPKSGDFGVDVIADRPGERLVVQVKNWRKPVNLKAVQEVIGGRGYYKAQHAAVVAIAGFQPSAVELARANDVLLLSARQLARINAYLPAPRPHAAPPSSQTPIPPPTQSPAPAN